MKQLSAELYRLRGGEKRFKGRQEGEIRGPKAGDPLMVPRTCRRPMTESMVEGGVR